MFLNVPGSDLFIDSSHNFYTSVNGDRCEVPLHTNDKNETFVELSLFDKPKKWYNLQWLYYTAWYDIYEEECFNSILFENISYEVWGINVFPYFSKPVYYKLKDYGHRYRYVPGFCRLAVDRSGKCINTRWDREINPWARGYKTITAHVHRRDELSVRYHFAVHRLVAMAWVSNFSYDTHTCVNHINGDKFDNRASNLEWCTQKDNARHAVTNYLYTTTVVAKLRDIFTGEIHEFPSLGRLAEFLGEDRVTLDRNRQVNYLLKGRYEIRAEDDDRPWFYVGDFRPASKAQYVYIVTFKDTEKTVICSGILQLKKLLGLSRHYRKNETNNEIVERIIKKFPNVSIETINLQPNSDRKIQVFNEDTKEVFVFKNIQKAVEGLDLPGNCGVRKALAEDGARLYHGYRFRYMPDNPNLSWPIENRVDLSAYARPIKVHNRKTGETVTLDSIKDTVKYLGVSRNKVFRMLNDPSRFDEYELSYAITDSINFAS